MAEGKQYDETNSGVLFVNQKKLSDRHPDYTGHLDVGGAKFWVSAWIKKSANGGQRISLAVKAKEEKAAVPF